MKISALAGFTSIASAIVELAAASSLAGSAVDAAWGASTGELGEAPRRHHATTSGEMAAMVPTRARTGAREASRSLGGATMTSVRRSCVVCNEDPVRRQHFGSRRSRGSRTAAIANGSGWIALLRTDRRDRSYRGRGNEDPAIDRMAGAV